MPFERGKPKTGGRLPGVSNKFTGAFREAVQIVYNRLGGHAHFLQWAEANPTEFYRIASRLIPAEIREDPSDKHVTVILNTAPVSGERPAIKDHRGNALAVATSLSAESPASPTPEALLPRVQSKSL
jgi:hypothetical protein